MTAETKILLAIALPTLGALLIGLTGRRPNLREAVTLTTAGLLFGNAVLTEIVFNRPGLGKLIVLSLNQRDYAMLQGLMVVYAFIVVIINLITDITYGLFDPRVSYS